ncbi:putative immunoglobulin-like domain containing protein [Namao virus]|nr:putative immunoglobulin-like domain containing protein [Namao virus]
MILVIFIWSVITVTSLCTVINLEADIEQTIELHCVNNNKNINLEIMWYFNETLICNYNSAISQKHCNNSRYNFDAEPNDVNVYLSIVNISQNDAGVYRCKILNQKQDTKINLKVTYPKICSNASDLVISSCKFNKKINLFMESIVRRVNLSETRIRFYYNKTNHKKFYYFNRYMTFYDSTVDAMASIVSMIQTSFLPPTFSIDRPNVPRICIVLAPDNITDINCGWGSEMFTVVINMNCPNLTHCYVLHGNDNKTLADTVAADMCTFMSNYTMPIRLYSRIYPIIAFLVVLTAFVLGLWMMCSNILLKIYKFRLVKNEIFNANIIYY